MSDITDKFKELKPEAAAIGNALKGAFDESVPHLKKAGVIAEEAFDEMESAARPHLAKAAKTISEAADKVSKKIMGEEEREEE